MFTTWTYCTNRSCHCYIAGAREHNANIVENGRNEQFWTWREVIDRSLGRLKTVCAIISGKWTFSLVKLPSIFAFCVCVTNNHASINPLTRDDDGIEQAAHDNAVLDLEEAAEGRREVDRRDRENLRRRER
ncbi:hypothetical protein BLNAU_4641 [Blattamonas nauphoetae]|nr:hypothetical protein BLNAU_4641 [Blattamonas nauphoetae]